MSNKPLRESLLAALKILNGPDYKDELLKASILLMLASIYQDTDFGLAGKMASNAYVYGCNLGNDWLALTSGQILAKVFDLQGEQSEAQAQNLRNARHQANLA